MKAQLCVAHMTSLPSSIVDQASFKDQRSILPDA